MFATLDPTSRRLRLPIEREIIINDTVGFIRDLPETLVAAFRATLEEISDSNLLVHVVDASSPQAHAHIESVEKILGSLDLNKIPRLIVLNKADLLDEVSLNALQRSILFDKGSESVAISAIQSQTLKPLIEKIGEVISQDLETVY
jgi:GTP-binding protein HflX